MKKKIGLACLGALLIVGTIGGYQAVAAAGTPPTKNTQDESATISNDMMCREENGAVNYSLNGNEWLSQEEYDKQYPSAKVEWWTSDEYAAWIDEQREHLNSLIGTDNGWYDGQGVYHTWTKESVNKQIAQYEKILADIKNGTRYSKDNGDGDTLAQIPPSDKVESAYSVDVIKSNGKTLHFGDYHTEKDLENALKQAVTDGTLTQNEVDSLLSK